MSHTTSKALVLVVEDNDDVRNFVTICLKRNGYAVAEAADGVEALDALADIEPGLILLDVLLPRMDGIEVLERLRASPGKSQIPVIIMSAVLQARDLEAETKRLQVASFLQKPFPMRVLIQHVENALGAPGHSPQIGSPQ